MTSHELATPDAAAREAAAGVAGVGAGALRRRSKTDCSGADWAAAAAGCGGAGWGCAAKSLPRIEAGWVGAAGGVEAGATAGERV
ncbi:MAG TPA: hypothetical protein VGJ10_02670 [Paraburkholderia sp.]